MRNKNFKDLFFIFLLLLFITIFFRKFFFQGKVPFPGNLLVWFFSPWSEEKWLQYPGGIPHQGLFGFDTLRMMYPWRKFSTDQILSGQWPLWDPYRFVGVPHLANFQTAIFFPPNVLYLFLPQIWAWTILLISQTIVAAVSTYFFTRSLKISPKGAFFAAFSYGFSTTLSVWLIYNTLGWAMALFPLLLFLIEKWRQKRRWYFFSSLATALSLILLSGHPQPFIYILGFSTLYFLFQERRKPSPHIAGVDEADKNSLADLPAICFAARRWQAGGENKAKKRTTGYARGNLYRTGRIKDWLFICFITFLLTSVAWLPTVEYYRLALREMPSSEFSFEKGLIPPSFLIKFLAPDFFGNPTTENYWGRNDYTDTAVYVGVIALIFALLAILNKRRKRIIFILGVFLPIVFSLDTPIARLIKYLEIPFLSTSVASRVLFLSSFSLAILAGFGTDDFFGEKKTRCEIKGKVFLVILFLFLVLSSFWIFLLLIPKINPEHFWIAHLKVAKPNLILPTAIFMGATFLFFLKRFNFLTKKVTLVGLTFLATLDLFYPANKVIPFCFKELVFPKVALLEFLQKNQKIYRFVGSEAGNIESNFSSYYGLFSTEGYDSLYPRAYGELVWAADSGNYREDISRSTVIFPKNRSETQYRLKDIMGVKFILEKDNHPKSDWDPNYDKFPIDRYQLIWQKGNWKVYENKKVLPRAFLISNYEILKSSKEIVERFYEKEFDPAKTLILEEPLGVELDREVKGKTEFVDYRPTRAELNVESSGRTLLFLSDNFYPGWQVEIDGRKTKIYRADNTFRAIIVPKGKHKVVFSFEPLSFKIGLIISSVTSVLFIGYNILCHSRQSGNLYK